MRRTVILAVLAMVMLALNGCKGLDGGMGAVKLIQLGGGGGETGLSFGYPSGGEVEFFEQHCRQLGGGVDIKIPMGVLIDEAA